MTIELRQRIESETLTLPELRPFIGRNVRIVVDDVVDEEALRRASDEFWNPPSLEEIIARQGVQPATEENLWGSFSAEDFDGFDEFIEEIRKTPMREMP